MRNLTWGLVLVVFGIMLLLNNLGIADFGDILKDYWPLLLILWGFIILNKRKGEPSQPPSMEQNNPSAYINEPLSSVESDMINESNVFASIFITNSSQNFKGGSVSTVFGDCIVDLAKCMFTDGEHVLQVHSVFGKTSVILPRGSAVFISASSILGKLTVLDQHKGGISASIDTKTNEYETSSRKLKIHISQVFGNVHVSS